MTNSSDIDEKLQQLASGKLSKAEQQALEQQLENDPDLKAEAEFMSALHTGFKNQQVSPPGELGLARLKREIQREQAMQQSQPATKSTDSEAEGKKNHAFWKPLAIAACAMFALQIVLTGPFDNRKPDLVPLSGEPLKQGVSVQVVFKDEASALQIQQALSTLNLRIIDGPGALGIYTLLLPEQADHAQLGEQLARLEIVEELIATTTE